MKKKQRKKRLKKTKQNNEDNKEQTQEEVDKKLIDEGKVTTVQVITYKTIKPVKYKPIELKLNDIYQKEKMFYMINMTGGSISRWTPNTEKIPIDEKTYKILEEYPTEEQYFKIIRGELK